MDVSRRPVLVRGLHHEFPQRNAGGEGTRNGGSSLHTVVETQRVFIPDVDILYSNLEMCFEPRQGHWRQHCTQLELMNDFSCAPTEGEEEIHSFLIIFSSKNTS